MSTKNNIEHTCWMNGKESNTLVEWMEKKERGGEDGYGTYEQKAPSNHFPKRKWEVGGRKKDKLESESLPPLVACLGVKSHGKVQKKIARTRLSLEGLATCEKMPKLVSACGGEKPSLPKRPYNYPPQGSRGHY